MNYETLKTLVWVVFFGVVFSSFYAYYQRRLLGDILRALISHEAQDEQSAKTLEEIGYGKGIKNSFAKHALRKKSGLRKTVCAVYEEKAPEKNHPDQLFVRAAKPENEQKYYVPEEKRIVAEVRYDGKGTNLKTLLISIAALLAAAIIIVSFLPWLINKFYSLMGTSNQKQEDESDSYITEEVVPNEDADIEETDKKASESEEK